MNAIKSMYTILIFIIGSYHLSWSMPISVKESGKQAHVYVSEDDYIFGLKKDTMRQMCDSIKNEQEFAVSQKNIDNSFKRSPAFTKKIKSGEHFNVKEMIVEDDQKAWIEATKEKMKLPNHIEHFPLVALRQLEFDDFYQIDIRIKENGKLAFPDGSFIVFMSHSSHHNPKIGDVMLAMDSFGHFYTNKGHICGGIANYMTSTRNLIHNVDNFFTYFVSDVDKSEWEKYVLSE